MQAISLKVWVDWYEFPCFGSLTGLLHPNIISSFPRDRIVQRAYDHEKRFRRCTNMVIKYNNYLVNVIVINYIVKRRVQFVEQIHHLEDNVEKVSQPHVSSFDPQNTFCNYTL